MQLLVRLRVSTTCQMLENFFQKDANDVNHFSLNLIQSKHKTAMVLHPLRINSGFRKSKLLDRMFFMGWFRQGCAISSNIRGQLFSFTN